MEVMFQSSVSRVLGWRASAGWGPIMILALLLLQSPANGEAEIRGQRCFCNEHLNEFLLFIAKIELLFVLGVPNYILLLKRSGK